ncbi:MAG TPA: methyltransferase domain-containing protein [Burkholderiaceae bacterium]|nr:methyltransferase domain-containing protein [Burkholderiaceae bacterium]
MAQQPASYLLAGQASELERLQLQSRVWEPAAQSLLAELSSGAGKRVLDIGCGVRGWLRLLSRWVGATGSVVGTDVDQQMLAGAQRLVDDECLTNITLVKDDLFASQLPRHSFDLVHSRFQIAPLGRPAEQIAAYKRLVRPGGLLVLEDPDIASWRINPDAPAVQRLIMLIEQGFRAANGNFSAGRELPTLLRSVNIEPRVSAHVVALPPGHPYLRLPIQFATALRPRLETLLSPQELNVLIREAEREIARPGSWGTTFTLVQAFGALQE